MATHTATAAASTVPARGGIESQTVWCRFNSGTTTVTSGDTVLLVKVPNYCTINNIQGDYSTTAANCPADFGIQYGTDSASASQFAAITTKGSITIKSGALPFHVSTSDGKAVYITCTPAAATATSSFIANINVFYHKD